MMTNNIYKDCVQFITHPVAEISISRQVERVCRGGIRWIQLRMKDCQYTELLSTAKEVSDICRRYGAVFIINDHVDIAKEVNADGVHLGLSDMSPTDARKILGDGKIIGATCNTADDILMRHRQAVDYIGLGPFRNTSTKTNLSPLLGIDGYGRIMAQCKERQIDIPIIAIGGIRCNDIPAIMQTGVSGIAVSSLITSSHNNEAAAKEIVSIIKKSKY